MRQLDDLKKIRAVDRSDMCSLIYSFPEQIRIAQEIASSVKLAVDESRIQNIVVAGLGGSAIGGDIIRSYLADELHVPMFVCRSYFLPRFVDGSSLCIASSYSGNTEETLSAYEDARSRKAQIICMTSGGELERRANADGVPVLKFPTGYPPRAALGFSAIALLGCIQSLSLVADKTAEIDQTVDLLMRLREEYRAETPAERNPAKKLAIDLFHALLVIYAASDRMDSVAIRWKGQFCENSKNLAFVNLFPELNHNEIVGWENPASVLKKIIVIVLRDRADFERVQLRMRITADLLKNKADNIIEIWSQGESLLSRIFSLVYLGDFTSFYLALLNGVDPTPVKVIDYLKKRLQEEKHTALAQEAAP